MPLQETNRVTFLYTMSLGNALCLYAVCAQMSVTSLIGWEIPSGYCAQSFL